ncbi:MAG: shikimate dehydrogenase [Mycobacteriales bacterium]
MNPPRRAAVLGSPISHSRSPVLHEAAYRELGLHHWQYTAHECGSDQLADFVAGLDSSWAGLSLTMPLKRVALSVADRVSPEAAAIGAANTLVLKSGESVAENTDAPGMVDALREAGVEDVTSVVVIGAGGTAQAALGAIVRIGAGGSKPTVNPVSIAVREPRRAAAAEHTAGRLGLSSRTCRWEQLPELLASADLVISTVPWQAGVALAELGWRAGATFLDVIYHPWPTAAARAAEAAGCTVVSGAALLLHQAAHQVRLMTGMEPPVTAMRRALATCLPG